VNLIQQGVAMTNCFICV